VEGEVPLDRRLAALDGSAEERVLVDLGPVEDHVAPDPSGVDVAAGEGDGSLGVVPTVLGAVVPDDRVRT
jgi:hypothetical protein